MLGDLEAEKTEPKRLLQFSAYKKLAVHGKILSLKSHESLLCEFTKFWVIMLQCLFFQVMHPHLSKLSNKCIMMMKQSM